MHIINSHKGEKFKGDNGNMLTADDVFMIALNWAASTCYNGYCDKERKHFYTNYYMAIKNILSKRGIN
jgi:hypothetical protein